MTAIHTHRFGGTAVRTVVSAFVGFAVAVPVGFALGFASALLAGWAAGAGTATVWILLMIWPMDAAATRSHAVREDPGRRFARLLAIVGSLISLGAVAVVLIETKDAGEVESFLLAGVSVLSVAASWALIQTDYLLRVAREYYTDPIGGIDFNQDDDPMYTDFAYFSFGLGMTYQVADTNVRTNAVRRIVLAQTLLAYLFGAVILATVINLVTGLG
ncbi:hypothetical protein ATC03_10880 [Agromyces aureus]|uniref:DUF1345 domain-containing protein n=1 Tax=Agromyces aureus TaxID=453304 RepID=A0A191WG45_9MICO|nr:hypothetical protein ATC03_10880 [Agromyces aureus]